MSEELLYESRQKTTTATVREFAPDGVRVSYNMQGEVKGQYNAARMETIDAVLRPDGTSDFEARIVDVTTKGEAVLISVKGTGKQVSPTALQVQGTESFLTKSQEYAWLNSAKGRFEGTLNPLTGEAVVKGFATK